jgi:hypothetical protein
MLITGRTIATGIIVIGAMATGITGIDRPGVLGADGAAAPDAALLARCVAHKVFLRALALYSIDDWRLPAPTLAPLTNP